MKVGILGGGLTALTLASKLKIDYEILEKNKKVGGLCRSRSEKGFTFDLYGGHILYSRQEWYLKWAKDILKDNVHQKKRNNRVIIKGRKIKYPFENDLAHLPLKENLKCLYYYLFNKFSKTEPSNFKEWIYHTFGKGIADVYLMPYNRKIWNFRPENMSMHWVAGRVPKPPKIDVLKSAIGIPTEGYKHQLYFYYPKRGGIESLIKALEKKAKNVKTNFEVKKVTKKGEKWIVSDGKSKKQYDKVVSTIPVTEFIGMLDDVPTIVKRAAANLKFNSMITVLIGLNVPKLNNMTAVYIPSMKVKFHRVCFMNNFSEFNAPKGKFAVIVEFTVNKGDGFYEKNDKEVIEHAVNGLHKMKLINRRDVEYTNIVRAKYAYVVYDKDYLRNIKIVRKFIEKQGIILVGRFAEFEYLNMDACVKRGLDLAERLNRMAVKNKKISLIILVYNRADVIERVIRDFHNQVIKKLPGSEFIIAEDGSTDGTKEILDKLKKELPIKLVQGKERKGYLKAFKDGLKLPKNDIIFQSDADGEHDPRDFWKLIKKIDDFDVVFGTRTTKELTWSNANMGWFLRLGNVVVAKLVTFLYNAPALSDVGCTMKLIKKEGLKKIQKKFNVGGSYFSPEFMILSITSGLKCIEIPVNYKGRVGTSKITGKTWKAFVLGIVMIWFIVSYRFRLKK